MIAVVMSRSDTRAIHLSPSTTRHCMWYSRFPPTHKSPDRGGPIIAQGKAKRVPRAMPQPWVAIRRAQSVEVRRFHCIGPQPRPKSAAGWCRPRLPSLWKTTDPLGRCVLAIVPQGDTNARVTRIRLPWAKIGPSLRDYRNSVHNQNSQRVRY